MNLRLKRDRRGASNVIVIVLGLVIIVAIVSNIVLWSYEMNQLDWEKMKEDMDITNVERVSRSSWLVAQSEYTVNIGSRTSGTYTDTQTINDQSESFREGHVDAGAGFKMEWGFIAVNDTFTTVNLTNTYISPVIVCVPSYTSGVPRSVRVRNALSTSFEVRVQNPSDTASPSTIVYYIVVEEGVWTSPIKLEAQKYDTNTVGRDNNWAYDTRKG